MCGERGSPGRCGWDEGREEGEKALEHALPSFRLLSLERVLVRHRALRRQADRLKRLLCPFGDVLRGVALLLACDETDERLLHQPRLGDAVRKDAEESHAAVGP